MGSKMMKIRLKVEKKDERRVRVYVEHITDLVC